MKVVVVGGGASAVHFARTALERGHEVLLVDAGGETTAPLAAAESFEDLKRSLDDPAAHFLGDRFEAVTYPGTADIRAGLPPPKRDVLETPESWGVVSSSFVPRLSLAPGGLGEIWNAGMYPLSAAEAVDFPFPWEQLAAAYDVVAERIGISGVEDDLARHLPVHAHLRPALPLEPHSRSLLERYEAHRQELNAAGVTLGRSRTAILPEDALGRKGCTMLGRCSEGCPLGALYTPAVTLRELTGRAGFERRGGLRVTHVRVDEERRVRAVVATRTDGSGEEEIPAERVVLGAGTLGTSRIFLESWRRATGETARLPGLLDGRQVRVPFVTVRMIRRPPDPRAHPLPQLVFGLDGFEPRDHVHAPLTTLRAASLHAIVPRLPLDIRTSLRVFRDLHAALGRVDVYLPDRRRADCWVELAPAGPDGKPAPLVVRYEPPVGERARIGRTLGRVRAVLRVLGAFALPGAVHVHPPGEAGRTAGTLPMTSEARPFTTDPSGHSRDFGGLLIADGAAMPFLPAKGPAFTLMANAVRIASDLR